MKPYFLHSGLPHLLKLLCASVVILLTAGCQNPQSMIEKGKAFHEEKKYGDAEIQFRRAIQKDPSLAAAHFGLAETLAADSRGLDALGSYVRAYELAPADPAIQKATSEFLLDIFLNSRRKPKTIYDQLNRLAADMLNKNAQSPQGLMIRGVLALSEKNYPQAVNDLKASRQRDPDNNRVALLLIEALYLDEQTKEAEALANSLIEKDPQNSAAFGRLYQILTESRQIPAAGKLLERQQAANPADASVALLRAGHLANFNNDNAAAEAIVREVMENAQQYPQGALLAGRAFMEAGSYTRALEALKLALSRPDSTEQGFSHQDIRKMLAECYWQTGRIPEAKSIINEARAQDPNDKTVHLAEAMVLLAENKPESAAQASTILDQLKAESYLDPQLDFYRGRALMQQGKIEEGVKTFQEMSQRQKGNLPARFALLSYYLERQKLSDALQIVDQIDRISPENEGAWQARLTILRRQGRLDEARNLLQQAKPIFPTRPWLIEEQGVQGLLSQRFDEALQSYQDLYRRGNRSHSVIAGLVEAYSGQKNYTAATQLLDARIKEIPNSIALRALRAELKARQGQLGATIAEFEALSAQDPQDDYLLRRLATFYSQAGRYSDALSSYQKIHSLGHILPADYPFWIQSAVRTSSADALRGICSGIEDKFSTDWSLANNCAYGYADLEIELPQAEQIARAAVQKNPTQLNLRDTLAWVLHKQGKSQEALTTLDTLIGQAPSAASFRYHRAVVLLALNRREAAQKDFAEARRLTSDPSMLSAIEKAMRQSN